MQLEYENPLLSNEELLKDFQARYGMLKLNQLITYIDESAKAGTSFYQALTDTLASANSNEAALGKLEELIGLSLDTTDLV